MSNFRNIAVMSENENDESAISSSKFLTIRNETKDDYLERISKKGLINSFSWDEFDIIEHLRTGCSGEVLKAKWKTRDIVIVLKTVADSEENNQEFKDNQEFTKEYAELGDLRHYLNHSNLDWEQKVNIARQVVWGLFFLHENEILHRDLHTKNVVIKNDESAESSKCGIRVIITDFGLSKVLPRDSTSNQLIGDEWQQPIELQQNESSEPVYNDEDIDIDVTYDEKTELPQILISETEYRENMHYNLVDECQLNGQRKSGLQSEHEDEQLDEQLKNERYEKRDNCDGQREDERNDERFFNKVLEMLEQMFDQFSPKELEAIERLPNNKADEIVNLVQSVAHRKKNEKL
ncbi:9754_t:CDS:2 [Cetraspora pellucida]|uniref:9754_t:CDS:1 n=1 Tax=Cetraspora pellucida TaxID=1433469 RepID=A0A9N9I2K0_9GLOM|nr:9754_t:CDS:2 [Cetraspora pellucida]